MSFLRSEEPDDATQTIEDDIEAIGLQQVDQATVAPASSAIDRLHVQDEIDLLADEQLIQWQADGGAAARTASLIVGELDAQVSDLETSIEQQREVVEAARTDMKRTNRALARHVRRAHDEAIRHYIRLLFIFLGDVVGVAASLINFGLLPWMAVVQGLALGGAIMAFGLVGRECKHRWQHQDLQRDFDKLTKHERRFAYVFAGHKSGESGLKIAAGVTAAGLLLIFGGVVAVQSATDGLAAGLFFGCLGAAIGLASAINYWAYGDFVADLVKNAEVTFKEADARLQALTENEARKEHGRASAEERSIAKEHELRGQAARIHMLALGKKVLRNNPGVAGHGPPAKTPRLGRVHSNGHAGQEVGS